MCYLAFQFSFQSLWIFQILTGSEEWNRERAKIQAQRENGRKMRHMRKSSRRKRLEGGFVLYNNIFFTKWSLRNAYSVWGVITPTVQRIGGAPWWTSSSASLATLLRRPKAAKCLRRRKRNLCAQNRVLFASRKLFSKMQGKYCNLHFDASICMKSDVPKECDQYNTFKKENYPINLVHLHFVRTEVYTFQT